MENETQKTETFTFDKALQLLFEGKRVSRQGQNFKFLELFETIVPQQGRVMTFAGEIDNGQYIWLDLTTTDILAKDWFEYKETN